MTQMVAKLDDIGTPIWIALLVLSFVVFWPVGLALLAFLLTSGRLGSHRGYGCASMARRRERWARPYWHMGSGNSAFDEYRDHTLKRLEGEQKEFRDFLKQLRMAKDRTEFDRFMANRNAPSEDDTDEEPDKPNTDEDQPDGGLPTRSSSDH